MKKEGGRQTSTVLQGRSNLLSTFTRPIITTTELLHRLTFACLIRKTQLDQAEFLSPPAYRITQHSSDLPIFIKGSLNVHKSGCSLFTTSSALPTISHLFTWWRAVWLREDRKLEESRDCRLANFSYLFESTSMKPITSHFDTLHVGAEERSVVFGPSRDNQHYFQQHTIFCNHLVDILF